jgi:NTP pyrophosphatase (non-canonical NTP hydrolase)
MTGGEPLTVEGFQRHIRERYHATDSARGTSATFMWLIEEVGELATALQNASDDSKPREAARQNLEEEFADVFAWLCTLANINEVDLADAVRRKYLDAGGPGGTK